MTGSVSMQEQNVRVGSLWKNKMTSDICVVTCVMKDPLYRGERSGVCNYIRYVSWAQKRSRINARRSGCTYRVFKLSWIPVQ